MENHEDHNLLSLRLGFWSSVLMLIAMFLYAIGLGLFIALRPLPQWTDLPSFLSAIDKKWLTVNAIIQFIGFLCAPLSIALLNSIHDYAEKNKKILARISISFSIVFTVLSSIAYYLQCTFIRQNIRNGTVGNLDLFINYNPNSITSSLTVLAWNFFIGLSFTFISPIFHGSKLNNAIKTLLILIGIISFIGLIGAIFEVTFLYGIYQVTITLFSIFLLILFSRFFKNAIVRAAS